MAGLALALLLGAAGGAPAPAALQNHTTDPYFPIYHVRPDDGWHTNVRRPLFRALPACWLSQCLALLSISGSRLPLARFSLFFCDFR